MFFPWILMLTFLTVEAQNCNDANETEVYEAEQNLKEGSITFSFNMLRAVSRERKGAQLFFAPHGVWFALVAAYRGARGSTRLELQKVLGLENANSREALQNIKGEFTSGRIFFQEGTELFDECVLLDDISFVDFEGDPESSRDIINAWAENATNGRIKDIVPALPPLTRMVIANALYFREDWLNKFNPKLTRKWRFTMASRREIWVNMMALKGTFLYGQSDVLQCRALELPYANNKLAMVVLLPYNKYSGVEALIQSLTSERLQELMEDMRVHDVSLRLPRFKIESEFELTNSLRQMGLRTLFERNRADLSGFTGLPEFSVDAVRHKAFVSVDEEGTEAGAATVVVSSRHARPLGPTSFIADYPFVFLIKDLRTELVLFVGIVHQPTPYEKDANQ